MNERCVKLCDLGSVAALALQIGQEAAAMAMHELTIAAPEEIQPSWPYVLAWSRIQLVYERAAELGDTKAMLDASKASAQLIRDVY